MKSTFKYIIGITCSLAAVFSCARIEEQEQLDSAEKAEMVSMTFSAVIADGDQTKTVLGGEMGDTYRKVMWQPGDTVRVCSSENKGTMKYKFTNVEECDSETATFVGEVPDYSHFRAFYPSGDNIKYYNESESIVFTQSALQTYNYNSFNRNSMPMVAKASRGEIFQFYSLCGVLAVNLTGTETIKSMSFTGYDSNGKPIPVAGTYRVYLNDLYNAEMIHEGNGVSTVTLDCGEGVDLDPSVPTAFYIVLPVGTYNTFTISIATTDGKIMLKTGTNPLTIKRANATKTGSLVFVEDVAFSLSDEGTANSYIVNADKPGIYSFDATVIGNGAYGFVKGVDFHTDSPLISPEKTELLWEDRSGVVSNVTFDGRNVTFIVTGNEGNALIAVKDASDVILWSWHIWVTDVPSEHWYYSATQNIYCMQDRNLGAIRADRGVDNEWWDANGLMYQWGRKDPMAFTQATGFTSFTTESKRVSLEGAINNPTVFYGNGYYQWNETHVDSLWTKHQKTIYDPCPVGYCVPPKDVWTQFAKNDYVGWGNTDYWNMVGEYNNGADFIYDGANSAYYPGSSYITDGWVNFDYQRSYLWSSESLDHQYCDAFYFYYGSYVSSDMSIGSPHYRTHAFNVRCMKDAGYEQSLRPYVELTSVRDFTSQGVTVEAVVLAEGTAPVTERGVIWGRTSNLEFGNELGYEAVGDGLGEFSYTITGLEEATKYYVRAYARNDYDISYSDVKSFNTTHDGNVFDLSIDGTANCYIISPDYGEYAFDATVKGNSTEPVGEIDEAVILWETDMTGYMLPVHEGTQVGDIIADATFKEGRVHVTLPFDPKPGNALIAVKDANGNILWSWHIWVTDLNLDKTPAKLNSGAVIMDRNLGALTTERHNILSYGLYYQWGRKEPFTVYDYMYTAPYDAITYDYGNASVEIAAQNPTIVYNDAQWGGNQYLWGAKKTMYDPCPAGWKVPVKEAFANMTTSSLDGYFEITSADRSVYFPYSGCSDGNNYYFDINDYGYSWTSTHKCSMRFNRWGGYGEEYLDVDYIMPVRCMKDEEKPVTGDGNDLIVDDKYEW